MLFLFFRDFQRFRNNHRHVGLLDPILAAANVHTGASLGGQHSGVCVQVGDNHGLIRIVRHKLVTRHPSEPAMDFAQHAFDSDKPSLTERSGETASGKFRRCWNKWRGLGGGRYRLCLGASGGWLCSGCRQTQGWKARGR